MKDLVRRSTHAQPLRRKALWAALTFALGLPVVHAQNTPAARPDGGTATTTIQAPNGVPVVNIAAPNGAGLSHNRYQQFDVAAQGLILNNSGAISSTQLAGYVYGNPNLSGGNSARLILNEVTSTAPSRLEGVIEVAGHAADVVIANPNGIDCSGCGFINASRGVLATGTPVLGADGSLSALRVAGGTLTIGGQGLDGSGIDRVDLIARAVAVNAGVWARRLNVVTGASRVDYTTLATQGLAGEGAAPAVALDVSALGGMYAGAIRLVGTEAGLGVNSEGRIAAQDGDLTLTNAGQVVLGGKTAATGNVSVHASDALDVGGTLAAGGSMNLSSGGGLYAGGVLYSGGAMALSAGGDLANGGQVQSQGGALALHAGGTFDNAAGAGVQAGGPITLDAAALANAGRLESAQDATLTVQGAAGNSGVLQADRGRLVLSAGTLDNTGQLGAGGDAELSARASLASSGTLVANGDVALDAASLQTAGTVQAGRSLTLSGGSLSSAGKLYALGGAWTAELGGAFAGAVGSDVYGSGDVTLRAASFTNDGGVEARRSLALASQGELRNRGTLQADGGDVALAAATLDNTDTVSAQANLRAQVVGAAHNGGALVAGQAVALAAANLSNDGGGQVQSGSSLALSVATLDNAGRLYAKGDATVVGHDLDNAATGQLLADGALTLDDDGDVHNAGVLQAGGDLALAHADVLANAAGATVYAGHDLDLSLAHALGNDGTLYAAHAATLAAGSVDNVGILRSGGSLSLESGGALDSSGAIQAQQDLDLASSGAFANAGKLYAIDGTLRVDAADAFTSTASGDLYAGGDVTLSAASLANAGVLEAGRDVDLDVQGAAGNGGSMQADRGDLDVAGATVANQGVLSAAGAMRLDGANGLDNGGQAMAGQSLLLTGASLANSGQMQSGADTVLQLAAIDNRGRVQAGGSLVVSGNRQLENVAGGQLLAAGDLRADTAQSLDNAGVMQAGAALDLAGAGTLANRSGGTLYGTDRITLQFGDELDNAGTIYGGQAFDLVAGTLDNGGTLRSDGALQARVQGNATNTGTAYALGDATWNLGGGLANDGVLAAAGDTRLTAAGLDGAGTLAAGLRGDGTPGATGVLQATATGTLAAHGHILAGGDLALQGNALDLSGSQARAGGDARLVATAGGIDQRGGDLAANGTLTMQTPGALLNGGGAAAQGGRISAQALVLQAASLDNRYGTLAQTGQGDLALDVGGAFDNAHGTLAANAGNLTIHAASLDDTDGAIQHAGTGTLRLASDGDLINAGGRIDGNGALVVRAGGTLDDTDGALGVAGTADVQARAMDNRGGALAADGVTLTLAQALGNVGGTLQSTAGLVLDAGTLDNTGGYLKASGDQALDVTIDGALTNAESGGAGGFIGGNGAVTLAAGSLRNTGQIYAGTTLAVNSQGSLVNDGGALQAMASLGVQAGDALSNRSGRIEAGAGSAAATLDVHGANLDNTGGRIADAGQGASTIGAGGAIANQGGTLGGQGDVTLAAASLDNRQSGHVAAGHDLALDLAGMDNRGGVLYAAADLGWRHAGARLANAGGSLGAGGKLSLTLGAIDNAGGELAADGDVALDLGAFTGAGRAVAGRDLALDLAGDYTNGSGNTLKANRDLTLDLAGDFANPAGATLQAVRNLSVSAADIANAAGADIASAGTTLEARGGLTNAGRIEGDAVTLKAADLANTGTLIGSRITTTANDLTNGADLGTATDNAAYQSALIAATDGIDLYVSGTLLNRDATIFTLGDLAIGADAAGARSQAVVNRSGDIEADGNVTLAAKQFTNERRVFETTTRTLSAAEQAQNSVTGTPAVRYRYDDSDPDHRPPNVDASQMVDAGELAQANAYCGANGESNTQRCVGYHSGSGDAQSFRSVETDTALSQVLLSRTSAEGRLLSGGDITLSGSVLNDKSTIAAGRDLTINGQAQSGEVGSGPIGGEAVRNVAWTPTVQVGRSVAEQVEFEHLQHDPRRWEGGDFQTYGTAQSSTELGLAQAMQMFGSLQSSASADARITAGDTVSITAHSIDNTVVGADGKPVHDAIGLGANAGSRDVSGQAAGGVAGVSTGSGSVGSVALGAAPAAAAGGSLDPVKGRSGDVGGQNPAASATGTTGTPLPPQTVAGLSGPHPAANPPQSGLYTIHSDPSSPYLVETDPRFTSYTQFISSDYLMGKLGIDPSAMRKRLGDGFYEERSVLDQITSLTGRRFLSDDTDALAQYRSLMDAGAAVAQQFDLSVGVALTPEQMAGLTQDMVWLVDVTVDGQTVLTPVVYLSAEHARELAAGGAVIAGKNVVLDASGDISNTGTIAASRDAELKASNLLNGGDLRAGNDLSVTAAQDILNGGTISAGGNVSLAAGNDVRSGVDVAAQLGAANLADLGAPVSKVALTTVRPGSLAAGGDLAVSAGRDLSLDAAPVSAGGNLGLAAGRDLTATATAITAGGDAQVLAGRDLVLAATGHTDRSGGLIDGTETTTHTVSTVTAGGAAMLATGRDLASQGAQVTGRTVGVSAGRDLLAEAVTDTTRTASQGVQGHTVTTTHTLDQTVRGSGFSGTQGVGLTAGRDAMLTAATVDSEQGAVTLAAGRDVALGAAAETHAWAQDSKTSTHGVLSSRTTKTHDATRDTYAIGSTLSGDTVTVAAGHDLTTQAAQLTADHALNLAAGHDVVLGAGEQSHGEEHAESVEKSSFFSSSRKRFGSVDPETYRRENGTASTQTWSVGTVLSGDTVTVGAGNDLRGTAAQIASAHDVTLVAGHDLVLDAGRDGYSESDGTQVSRTGLMNGGGFSVLIGNRTTEADTTVKDVSYTGSLVGSTDGQVTLTAGHDVHLTGSDVLSQTGTTIVGQDVTIDAALGSTDIAQKQRVHTGGITVGVGGALAGAATAVHGDARRGGQVTDSRLKALYATKAAYEAKEPGQSRRPGLSSGWPGQRGRDQAEDRRRRQHREQRDPDARRDGLRQRHP